MRESERVFKRFPLFSAWAVLLGAIGGIAVLATLLLAHSDSLPSSKVNASTVDPSKPEAVSEAELGPRHQLTYDQWVTILRREASAVAQTHPERLHVLAGDSLSLWFPSNLLPEGVTWLNQGISGETSYGLLRRLKFFDRTKPQVIFVMIGINDLIRGVRDETLLANQREIVRHLKVAHPSAKIVIQSILPHGGDRATKRYITSTFGDPAPEQNPHPRWVNRLPAIPNPYIRKLNQRLAIIAREERVEYIDLHPFFTDQAGNLQDALTTDGLHLSEEGYVVWRSQLEQLMEPSTTTTASQE